MIHTDGKPTIAMRQTEGMWPSGADDETPLPPECGAAEQPYFDIEGNEGTLDEVYSR